ncbi:MAG TPA: peroxidase-related enzyme [Planctomycetota bacterium]|nr:peroxidase-related enzyme [Planctomycetota bacterium]
MAHLPIVEESQASGDVARVFEDFKSLKGTPFVPNFFKTLALAPNVAQGTWRVYRDVGHLGSVPRAIKEMIFVAVSRARNCQYCEAAHLALCKLYGVDPKTRELLTQDLDALEPARTREIVKFGVKAATDPRSLTDQDYARLRQNGLNESDIVEVIGMAAFSAYATIIADATKIEVDPGFKEMLK